MNSVQTGLVPYIDQRLFKCLLKNSLDKIPVFVKCGADINGKNEHFNTPLHNAASRYNLKALKILLSLGAEVNSLNSYQDTPLSYMIYWARKDLKDKEIGVLEEVIPCIIFLLNAGSNIENCISP